MRTAIFRCTNTDKVLFCVEDAECIEMGSGFVKPGEDELETVRNTGQVRFYKNEPDKFSRFVNSCTQTMRRVT